MLTSIVDKYELCLLLHVLLLFALDSIDPEG